MKRQYDWVLSICVNAFSKEIEQVEQIISIYEINLKGKKRNEREKTAYSLSIVRKLMMKLEEICTFAHIIVHFITRTVLLSLPLVV